MMLRWLNGSRFCFAPTGNGAGGGMGASGVANPATRADRADERSDEQLLEAYLNGDNPAFQRLVERYQRELYHFLVRFLGDRAAAEGDAVDRGERSPGVLRKAAQLLGQWRKSNSRSAAQGGRQFVAAF